MRSRVVGPTAVVGRAERVRIAVTGLLLAASAGACMNPPLESSVRPTTPAVRTTSGCPASGATVSIGSQDAAMGLRVVELRLRNCGTVPYQVNGYPQMVLLDAGQRRIEVTTRHGAPSGITDPGPSAVTLQPGDSAKAILSWRNTVTLDGGGSVTSTYLAVTPTATEGPQTLQLALDVGNTNTVTVTAWHIRSPL